MNRDLYNNAPAKDAARVAIDVIDRLQNYQPHLQMHGLLIAFLAVADHWGMPIQEAFTATKNMLADPIDGDRPEFRAVKRYVAEELRDVR